LQPTVRFSVTAVNSNLPAAPPSMATVSIHCKAPPAPRLEGASVPFKRSGGVTLSLVIAAVSAALRLLMLSRQGGLFSDIEYDDGVHLGSSLLIAHGHVLYRDQVFLHPPGISLLLLPFAWASAWVGQPTAFALTRLTTVVVSAAVAGLLTYLVRRGSSSRRALLAGSFAAVLAPSIVAGSTLMLEPWLGLFALLAVERLTRSSPRRMDVALAGVYLGVATTIKAWGVIPLAGVAIWLLWERRSRETLRLMGAAAVTIAAVIGPFLVLGGNRLLNDIAWTQLRRPPDGVQGLLARMASLLGRNGHLSANSCVLSALILAGIAIVIARAARTPGVARLSAIVLAIAIPVFANAPSFFFHYGDFFTPWAALVIATQPAIRWPQRIIPSPIFAAAAAIVVFSLLVQSVGLVRHQRSADVNGDQLQRLVGQHGCVVSDQVSLLVLAGAFDRKGCPSWLDPRGAALTELRGAEDAHFYPNGFRRLPRWQHEYLALMSHADVLILSGEPCGHSEWTTATCHWVQAHFRRVAKVGYAGPARTPVEVWRRLT
jgi:alpha-1,2-mannosyltransferase